MIKPKTLLILTPGFPGDEAEDDCLPFQQVFVKSLKENNPWLDVVVLTFQYPYKRAAYLWYGANVISFNGANRGKFTNLRVWFRVWQTLKKVKKESKPIGILSFWLGECALIGKYFGSFNHIKHFSWISGQDARKGNKLVKFIRPRANELIAISDFIAYHFYENYQIKPKYIIPNAIDKKMFSTSFTDRKDIDILGVGSLISLKRWEILISVVNEISKKLPSVKAHLCGDGPKKNELISLVESYHLENNMVITGKKSHKEVLHVMQRSKILIHPSSYEGFSGACLEALAAGAHVISFCKPMTRDIEHWHIVDSKEELIKKALEILNDTNPSYIPVLPYSIIEITKQVMDLFLSNPYQAGY